MTKRKPLFLLLDLIECSSNFETGHIAKPKLLMIGKKEGLRKPHLMAYEFTLPKLLHISCEYETLPSGNIYLALTIRDYNFLIILEMLFIFQQIYNWLKFICSNEDIEKKRTESIYKFIFTYIREQSLAEGEKNSNLAFMHANGL